MYLFVGLGNPGKQYEQHRHNVGFMLIDQFCQDQQTLSLKQKYHGAYEELSLEGKKVAVLKPMTYMNKSGLSVGEAVKFYKIPPENIFVFYDELDLPPGKVRVKFGGGHGGHNGIRDIINAIGKDFWRIRIGIGHPGHKDRVTSYVLSNFSKQDQDWLGVTLSRMAHFLPILIDDPVQKGATNYMNKLSEA